MEIIVIGATGMVGSRVVAEAAQRGHDVVAASRSGREVAGATRSISLDLDNTADVVAAIDATDAAVLAVPGERAGDQSRIITTHEALIASPPKQRMLIVGGAGSLFVAEGLRMKDADGFPADYKAEADAFTTILEDYEKSEGVDWTIVSPAPVLAPGTRTGEYTQGLDNPVGDTISAEDLAVAIVDELEKPQHRGHRFAVAAKPSND